MPGQFMPGQIVPGQVMSGQLITFLSLEAYMLILSLLLCQELVKKLLLVVVGGGAEAGISVQLRSQVEQLEEKLKGFFCEIFS